MSFVSLIYICACFNRIGETRTKNKIKRGEKSEKARVQEVGEKTCEKKVQKKSWSFYMKCWEKKV